MPKFFSFLNAVSNFIKASILSLLVIGVIVGLLTQMDQAFAMVVDLVEKGGVSFFLSFLLIYGLALSLSHYPIYTYYAANLNNSDGYTIWKEVQPFKRFPLRWWKVYTYRTNNKIGYAKNRLVNALRYFLGVILFGAWAYIILVSFEPNLIFDPIFIPTKWIKYIVFAFIVIAFLVYTRLKKRVDDPTNNKPLLAKLAVWFFFCFVVSVGLLAIILYFSSFSKASLLFIILATISLLFTYVFFRLIRSKLTRTISELEYKNRHFFKGFIKLFKSLEKSENYLLMFAFYGIISFLIIIYSVLAAWIPQLPGLNGIPVLLAYLYLYSYIIANLMKYFFVTNKISKQAQSKGTHLEHIQETRTYKWILWSTTISVLLIVVSFFKWETRTHELDLVKQTNAPILEANFIESLNAIETDAYFFIASQGGGLKANVWTLNVMQQLQTQTNGKLLDKSVALSGASGGSLGLALYTALYDEHAKDFNSYRPKIDRISEGNYTSVDLSLMFGPDMFRKVLPLNFIKGKDRPYYSMLRYQNAITGRADKELSKVSFREYWKDIYKRNGHIPSLIMNTASNKGQRGILWSVKPEEFADIFPFSQDLAELKNNQTLTYYQAVSMTNRFPLFSPSAKVKHMGHYIDAGAIDNSGLLGCLDVYQYLKKKESDLFADKHIVFIEIINGKSSYVQYLLRKFEEQNVGPGEKLFLLDNESESSTISNDISGGISLSKIPGYLNGMMRSWDKASSKNHHIEIYMPQRVTIADVESVIGGDLDEKWLNKLEVFLDDVNASIQNVTEGEKGFWEDWEYYEPVLSRHLSESCLKYNVSILDHPFLKEQFSKIKQLAEK